VKTQQKKACELGLDGPFSCSAGDVLSQLRTAHQDGLTDFAELSGYVTTPFKKLGGQLSWRETACHGSGVGIPYRNSQRSTDGYCTVDVKLISFVVDGQNKPPGDRFIRLEMPPGGRGSAICANRTISTLDTISFGGPVKIDKHFPGERWLEVHVTDEFDFVQPNAGPKPAAPGTPPGPGVSKPRQPGRYVVVKGDCLSRIAERTYGRQVWRVVYDANHSIIKNPDVIFPGQDLALPAIHP
jgi:phage tail protein X